MQAVQLLEELEDLEPKAAAEAIAPGAAAQVAPVAGKDYSVA